MKECKFCGETKTPDEMASYIRKGTRYIRSTCKACKAKASTEWHRANPEKSKALHSALHRRLRSEPGKLPACIWQDTRRSDKKAGLTNDLTKEFIATLIQKGCFYCGETQIRMTLDRIDNNQGHLMSNVVSACIRCNYARRAMPYEAWLLVAKGMREAREAGLFGDWTGRCR